MPQRPRAIAIEAESHSSEHKYNSEAVLQSVLKATRGTGALVDQREQQGRGRGRRCWMPKPMGTRIRESTYQRGHSVGVGGRREINRKGERVRLWFGVRGCCVYSFAFWLLAADLIACLIPKSSMISSDPAGMA